MTSESTPEHRIPGIWAPACTPLDPSGGIDHARFGDHLQRLLDGGCSGVVVFGTTGEATSFSTSERIEALEAVSGLGLDTDSVMVGTGCASVADSIALSRHALGAGYDRHLVLPPFYYGPVSDEGLFRSFAAVVDGAADAGLRVYLYHIPQISGVPITGPVIDRLRAEYGSVVAGIKDSSADPVGTEAFMATHPWFDVVPGNELFLLRLLRGGASACITATANVNSVAIREVYDAWLAGDDAADEMQAGISRFRNTIDAFPRIAALKYLVGRVAGADAWSGLRPPLMPLSATQRASLTDALDALTIE